MNYEAWLKNPTPTRKLQKNTIKKRIKSILNGKSDLNE